MFYTEEKQFAILNSSIPVGMIVRFFVEDVDNISLDVAEVILFRSCMDKQWRLVADKIFSTSQLCSKSLVLLVADLCCRDSEMFDILLSSEAPQSFVDEVVVERNIRSGLLV